MLVTVVVALGVKNSVGFNNVLNVINLVVWVFIMIAGLFFVNAANWEDGRFLPFGWSGVTYSSVTATVNYSPGGQHLPLDMESFCLPLSIQKM